MKKRDQLQTIALTFQEMCQGEMPWIGLGNFMNDWFDYAKDQRLQLVIDSISLPPSPDSDILRWAAFCAASVEWLCQNYGIACPEWVENLAYFLSDPWFDSPAAHKPQVRERLVRQTPEPFTRRNIYCGNRMFNNKYEFAEQHRQRLAIA
jgi:hypothetical protein